MLRRIVTLGLAMGMAAWIVSACGSSSKPLPAPPGHGALFVFVGDVPACDILALRPLVTGLTLTAQSGGAVSVIPSTSSPKVNFAALRDSSTILSLTSVNEGTYTQATIIIGVPQFAAFDSTLRPPIKLLTANLTTMSTKVDIQPSLQVIKNKVNALRIDLDLIHSLKVDNQGQLTGDITPAFRATPVVASGNQGFGDLEDLIGFVRSVTPAPSGTFNGSILLQLLAGTGPALSFNTTNTTNFFGVSGLGGLPTGEFLEVDAFIDENGNIVAKSVEAENLESINDGILAYLGYVTAISTDSTGKVTQFNLYVRETEPDDPFDINPDSVVTVNVSPSTVFQFSSRATNFANLPFDATAMAVGQEVVVHGKFTKATDKSVTVAADKIYSKLNAVQGGFSSLVQVASDGVSGAFRLAPCFSLFQQAPILVFTNSQTAFVNVSGLGALTPQPTLLVKGLLFFELNGGTLNGVTVPPRTLVLLAKQVHQF